MEPLPQTQSIAGVFTPRLVARLHREGFEGTLRLHAGGATRVIYFRRGDIASAASNAEDDRLHNIFIREGRLTGPQVEMARSRQRPGASLGKVLIELGFLTPSELLQGARRQVRQILAACFALTEGTWQSVAGPLGPEVTNLGLPARRLIFDALMEAGDRRAIVREMGSMESVYQPTATLAEALSTLRLEPAMEEVARMIDGRATLREISSLTRLDDFTVSRIVLGLDILGLAGLATRPEPAVPSRPGRVIPVESDDDTATEVAVHPAEAPTPATAPATLTTFAPESPQRPEPAPTAAADRERPLPSAAEAAPVAAEGTTAFPVEPEEAAEAPAQSPEAEPPPFPRDELPAFADGAQEDTPVWTVNPETGEKVHEGPIELTFDGSVAPGRSARPNARLVLGAGLAVVVVAALAVSYYMRSQARETSETPHDAAAEIPAAAAPAESAPAPDEAQTGFPGATGEPAGGAPAAVAGQSGSAPAETAESPAPPPAAEGEVETEPAAGGTAGQAPGSPADRGTTGEAAVEQASPPATVGPGGPQLAPGQAMLDAGDLAGAASAFSAALAALPADRVTLQLMIACQDATVRKARAALSPGDPLFVTPFTMQGRSCHRLLWGIYPDRDAAQAGAATLPPYFTGAGIKPVAVSIGRLRGPS